MRMYTWNESVSTYAKLRGELRGDSSQGIASAAAGAGAGAGAHRPGLSDAKWYLLVDSKGKRYGYQ